MNNINELCIGVSREFLEALPCISSKAAQILLLPLALQVKHTKNYNDNTFYIKKSDIAEILNFPTSYQKEGQMNQYLSRILTSELLSLEVAGIKILDAEQTYLTRGWYEVTYTQEAMHRFFQGLKIGKYLTIKVDTLSKMKAEGTWNFVKELLLYYNFRDKGIQTLSRHTKVVKRILGLGISDYVVSTSGKFDRTRFERRRLDPIIEDLLTMTQFRLYPNDKGQYLYKSHFYNYGGERFVENYNLQYMVVVPRKKDNTNNTLIISGET